jgi:hypothetical protein
MDDTKTLFVALADHLEAIAITLRRFGTEDGPGLIDKGDRPDALRVLDVPPSNPDEAVAKARAAHPLLGSHQELVIRSLASAHPNGLSVSQINPNSSTQPNTYITLDKLTELRLVRRDDQTHPRRYFLGPRMLE